MKSKFTILVFLFCNVFFANANSKTAQPLLTIFYPGSPACVKPGTFLDFEFREDPIGIDPDIDINYEGGTFSSTVGLVIDPATGVINAGESVSGIYIVTYTLVDSSLSLRTTVKLLAPVIPTFNSIATVCKGGVAPTLPRISTNRISGTWSPSVINTSDFGSTEYFFTPSNDQCASPTSITVTITTAEVIPTFNPIVNVYCLNATAQILPTTSNNGIVGTWKPSIIDTTTIGPTIYTFVPNSGDCVTSPEITITVYRPGIPDFQDININTNYQQIPVLATISPNGISGTWNPSVIDSTRSGNYTFTPNSNICATQKTITVSINYPIVNIPPPLQTCNYGRGFGSFDLNDISMVLQPITPGNYRIDFFSTLSQAQSTLPIGLLPSQDYTNLIPFNQTVYARFSNQNNTNYHSVFPVQLIVNQSSIQPVISSINNIYNVYLDANNNVISPVVLSSNFYGTNISCIWTRDDQNVDVSPKTSFVINTFTGLNIPRRYKVTVVNNNNPGCSGVSNTVIVNQIRVPAPTGNTVQNFTLGQTLANLVVAGSNIRWYSTLVPSPATLLPLTTPLSNGIIYYATQTIAGAESPELLGVTAISQTLSNVDFNFIDLKYSPNPFSDVLNIQSGEIIKNITILNVLGQEVYNKKYNNVEIKLDLLNLKSGHYFAKIESDSKSQVIKVIKK
jgi:hypothetical protein